MTAKQTRPRWKQRLLKWLLSPKELDWLQEGEQQVRQIHSELYKIFNWIKWLKEYTDTLVNETETDRFLSLEAWLATRQEFEEDLDPEEQEELQRQLERQMEEQEWMRRLGMDERYEAFKRDFEKRHKDFDDRLYPWKSFQEVWKLLEKSYQRSIEQLRKHLGFPESLPPAQTAKPAYSVVEVDNTLNALMPQSAEKDKT